MMGTIKISEEVIKFLESTGCRIGFEDDYYPKSYIVNNVVYTETSFKNIYTSQILGHNQSIEDSIL